MLSCNPFHTVPSQVPEETRVASIDHARMEAYKKDQTVYMIGDLPSKFYMILTGAVEVSGRRAETHISAQQLACLHAAQAGDTSAFQIRTVPQVWAHPAGEPRKRTVLASLKRGQSFGEKDILNRELRTECVTPTR